MPVAVCTAYAIAPGEPTPDAVRRIAREELDQALAEIGDASLDLHERVHAVRKRCKKLRGLLRLVRPGFEGTYQRENEALRDAARVLSTSRDAQTLRETCDGLLEHFSKSIDGGRLAPIRARLTRELEVTTPQIPDQLAEVNGRLMAVRQRVDEWAPRGQRFKSIGKGLKKTYGRARKSMTAAGEADTAEAFHDWRKRVKYHWYHLRLLGCLEPAVLAAAIERAHRLSTLLGDDHDLAVLVAWLDSPEAEGIDPQARDATRALALERSAQLRAEALELGQALLAESPGALRRRLRGYYRAMRCGQRGLGSGESRA